MSEPGSGSGPEPGLLDRVYTSPLVLAATSDRAWLQAMLDVEAALAVAGTRVGLLPEASADAIVAACRVEQLDVAAVVRATGQDATPVVELVRQLRAAVGDAADDVHLAATSQDVVDTAAQLVARRALEPCLLDARTVARRLADLAGRHRDTPQVGRSMLQHGQVTTFGAWCATRLVGVEDAADRLQYLVDHRLAVQLGGAVGTLAPAGAVADKLVHELAAQLDLAEPLLPWHTTRGRVAEVAGAVGVLSGELAAAAQDVVLLASTEIGEVRLRSTGRSSAMPHKRNPAAAVLALAAAHRVPGQVATLLATMPQELQRSAGRWQAEWGTWTELLRLLGGVTAHTAETFALLEVDSDRMAGHVADLAAAGVETSTGAATSFVDRALRRHESRAAQ